jgi:hypothetical protein
MRTLLLTAVLLWSSLALGQTARVQVQFPNQTGDTLSVGSGDCGLTRSVSWSVATGACDVLTVWATRDTDCRDRPSDQQANSYRTLGTISTSTLATQTTGTLTFNVSELPFPAGDGGETCGGTNFELSFQVCASTKFNDNLAQCSTTFQKAAGLELIYDALAPSKPTIGSVAGLDNGLAITVNAPTDASRLLVEVLREGEVVASEEQASDNGTFRVRQLQNGVAHEVRAYALDDVGNRSESSDPSEGTPVNTRGFYEEYLASGGKETGGCGAAGGGLVGSAVLAVMGLWLFSRRGRS